MGRATGTAPTLFCLYIIHNFIFCFVLGVARLLEKITMRKIFIILCIVMCSVCVKGQKLGDYMEIDGVPGFVFYLDETGEHGLVMSMWPIMAGWEKIQTKSLRKEGILTEEHMKKLSFPKEKKITRNKNKLW